REQGDRGAAIYVDGIEERVIGARLVNGALRGGIQVAQDDDGDDERDDCSSDAEDDRLQIGDAVLVDVVLGHIQLEHEVVPGSDDAGCVDNSHAVPPPLEGRLVRKIDIYRTPFKLTLLRGSLPVNSLLSGIVL